MGYKKISSCYNFISCRIMLATYRSQFGTLYYIEADMVYAE